MSSSKKEEVLLEVYAQNKKILAGVKSYLGWYTYLLSNESYNFSLVVRKALLLINDILADYISGEVTRNTTVAKMSISNFIGVATGCKFCAHDESIKNEIYMIRAIISDNSLVLCDYPFITNEIFKVYEIILSMY